MRFTITIEQDEDGIFVAECPAIPGCISQGKTEKEVLENIKDAIKQCLEVRAEKGMPLTVAMREIEVMVQLELPVLSGREVAKGTLRKLITRAGIAVGEFLKAMK